MHYSFVNRISGLMVSIFASSAVDRGFEPQSGQTKDYKKGEGWAHVWLVVRNHRPLRVCRPGPYSV